MEIQLSASQLTRRIHKFLRLKGLHELAFHVRSEESGDLLFTTVSVNGVDDETARAIFDELRSVEELCGFDFIRDGQMTKDRP